MKRIPRDPEKFEIMDLFDAIGQKRDFQLNDASSEKAFLDSIKISLDKNKTPINLHGRRVESMFGYVAAALGKSILVKKEDCGDVFVESDARIPDYRIVLETGKQCLVEVKNCHDSNPHAKFSFKKSYIEELKTYADMVKLELMIAIYWSRWNRWVLINLEDLHLHETKYYTTFIDSVKQNQMFILGDILIGTTPSLVLRLISDQNKQSVINSDNMVEFTIGDVLLICSGQPITMKEEKDIAFYIMLYGEWPASEPKANIEDGKLLAIDYVIEPLENNHGQRFEIIGSISGMISRQYNAFTAPSGNIERFTPKVEPDMLGIKIPDNYKGKQLPLWRLILQPTMVEES